MSAPKPDYSSKAPALVTGATGYVAGWLVKKLLEQGKTVHAAVRNPDNKDKVAHLVKLAADLPGEIKFFKGDLLDEGSYDEAMKGCDVVFHTASPFTNKITDPQKDLVDPAVNGTKNVLNAASRTKSVKRVVVTSSVASIYGDAVDVASAPNQILTEEIWNTTSRLDHQSYSYSKVEAEKAAWAIAEAQGQWSMVTINPSFVIGPGVAFAHNSESFDLITQLGDGTSKMGAPEYNIGAVDVRDVAEAHLRVGYIEEASGRHIVSGRDSSFLELGQMLSNSFGDEYPFPKSNLPKFMVWLIGPMLNKLLTREVVSKNVGHAWAADNSKSKEALGLVYSPQETALAEMFQQLIDAGRFKKA